MDSGEAIRTYPEITSELTSSEILPILSFEDEISLMNDASYSSDTESLNQIEGISADQLASLERQGIAIDKHKKYQTELNETIVRYSEERKKRVVRMAEVINLIDEQGESPELRSERDRLTAEVQILDAYLGQAEANVAATDEALVSMEEERSVALTAVGASEVDSSEIATITEEEEITPDPIDNTPEFVEPEVVVEEVASIPDTPDYTVPTTAARMDANDIPDVLVADIFTVREASPTGRVIAMNAALPSGTVYQVQVGAFRNPIPEALFSEFDPIMGTRLDNGITRYKVGLFTDERSAITARDAIRGMGYRDAFVVKYVDGSRDGVINGAALAQNSSSQNRNTTNNTSGNPANSAASNASNPSNSNGTSNSAATNAAKNNNAATQGSSNSTSNTSNSANSTEYYDSVAGAAPATQVEKIDGLFYTVQVGVYSKPVTSSSVFNISPLNSELTNSGMVKYTSGIFDDPLVAAQWKERVIEKGVSDAFVTAYYNGERVSLNRAAILKSAQGDDVLVNMDELNALDTDRQGQAVWEMVSTSELFSEEVADQIQFKIRMGPYYERIPDKDVKVILDFENNVVYSQTEDGAIVYTTKGNMTYDESQEWRNKFLELGVTNANIIALRSGEEIPVKQALDFLLK